jgi:hypothetical protein
MCNFTCAIKCGNVSERSGERKRSFDRRMVDRGSREFHGWKEKNCERHFLSALSASSAVKSFSVKELWKLAGAPPSTMLNRCCTSARREETTDNADFTDREQDCQFISYLRYPRHPRSKVFPVKELWKLAGAPSTTLNRCCTSATRGETADNADFMDREQDCQFHFLSTLSALSAVKGFSVKACWWIDWRPRVARWRLADATRPRKFPAVQPCWRRCLWRGRVHRSSLAPRCGPWIGR